MSPTNKNESGGDMLRRVGTDAALWAVEMAEMFNQAGDSEAIADLAGDPTPGGMLHGWLCNAIEAGRSAGYSTARDRFDPGWLDRLAAPAASCGSPDTKEER